MQNDRTFQQALEELQARLAKELHEAALARVSRLNQGATVAEAVADIANRHKRNVVHDFLLRVRVMALVKQMETLDLLNQKQAKELLAYLNEHLRS